MKKRGFAIPTTIVLISVLFMFVAGLMKYSGQEMTNVKRVVNYKQAELLAYSGINWASTELQKGRWWVKGKKFDPKSKVDRATGGTQGMTPFGPDMGKAYVVCEEFESANPSPVSGYDNVQRLDHIRVYSIGEYEGQRVLVYGKFIMSPEPFLNSDSTDGAEVEAGPVNPEDGTVNVLIPRPWSQDGPVPTYMRIRSLSCAAGLKIDPNSILGTLEPHPDDPINYITMTWDIKSPVFGFLEKVNMTIGQKVRADEVFGVCKDELMTAARASSTLKKMVRITKIANREITDLDLTDFDIRRAKIDPMIKKLSQDYVVNYAKNLDASDKLEDSFNSPPLPKLTTEDDVLQKLEIVPPSASLDPERSGNTFMRDMLNKWIIPGLPANLRKPFPPGAEYHLGVGKSNPRPEIIEVLTKFGRLGDIETEPRRHPELYQILGTDKYLEVMDPDITRNVGDFIHRATMLPDAAKKITITFDKGTPLEDAPFKAKVLAGLINPADYWWWSSKNGWYTMPTITIEAVEIPYSYVNKTTGTPFSMELGFVLNYLRKHYDEGMALPPTGTIRAPSDQSDTPQAPGPPDSTGCKYTGVSS